MNVTDADLLLIIGELYVQNVLLQREAASPDVAEVEEPPRPLSEHEVAQMNRVAHAD